MTVTTARPGERPSLNQYDELAEYYDHLMLGGYYDYEQQARTLSEILPPQATVLEVGVGTGLLAEQLVKAGHRVVGIDHTTEMLDRARARLGDSVELHQADVCSLDLGQTFDAAISNGGVWYGVVDGETHGYCGHLPDREALATSVHNVLQHIRPGGQLILSVQDVHRDRELKLPDEVLYRQEIRALPRDDGHEDIEKTYLMTRDGELLNKQVLTLSYYPAAFFEPLLAQDGFQVRPFVSGSDYIVADHQAEGRAQ
jgi:SAM-dependent methyltransferase